MPKSAATVVDDWHVAGLAGTGSKSFIVDDLLIPPHRFQDHVHSDDGTGPGTKVNRAGVFRTPRASVAALGFTALAVGIAEAFLAAYLAHTRARNSRGLAVAEFSSTQMGLAKAAGQIEGAAEKLKARFEAAFIVRHVSKRSRRCSPHRAVTRSSGIRCACYLIPVFSRMFGGAGA